MSGKVRITQEQADAIEKESSGTVIEMLVKCHNMGWEYENNKCLNELSLDEFLRALYIGYEVKPEFEVGDWVYVSWINKDADKHVFRVTRTMLDDGRVEIDSNGINTKPPLSIVRHATPEEIAKEKERRWWAKHDRDVWELKQGDVLRKLCSSFDFEALEVENVDDEYITLVDYRQINYKTTNMKINYKVVCFAEDRKDVDHE